MFQDAQERERNEATKMRKIEEADDVYIFVKF